MWTVDSLVALAKYLGAALVLIFIVGALLGLALWALFWAAAHSQEKGTPHADMATGHLGLGDRRNTPAFLRPVQAGPSRPVDFHEARDRAPVQRVQKGYGRLAMTDQITREQRMRLVRQR